MRLWAAAFLSLATSCFGATSFVDNSLSTGANDGTSWANAWHSITSITASAGDTVQISGGPTGSAQTYNMSAFWNPPSGSAGNVITYEIGQDQPHSGTAVFNYTGGSPSGNPWLSGPTNVAVIGTAADGRIHFVLSNYTAGFTNINAARVAYVNFGGAASCSFATSANGCELDHFYAAVSDLAADHFLFTSFVGTLPTDNKIHDGTLLLPRLGGASSGTGADGFQCNGNGWSIYNCNVVGFTAVYTSGQHQDGEQATGNSSGVSIYNNVFTDCGDSGVFLDGFAGGFTNWKVYNNVIQFDDATMAAGSGGGIIAGVDGGFSGTPPCVFSGVILANNTVVNLGSGGSSVALNNVTGFSATYTGCFVVNNVTCDSGAINTTGNSTSTVSNNATVTNANGATTFTTYSRYAGALNNYTPLSTAVALRGAGVSQSSVPLDASNHSRPATPAIGAFEWYVSGLSALANGGAVVLQGP